MPRGRVRVLDEGKQREVCAIVSAGCSLQAAAHYVQCAPNTIRREAARNLDFGRRFRDARLQAQLSPLQAMRKAAANHWRAAAWMLERSDPDHFARRPTPAFRSKQAQALRDDILAILSAEIENPFLLRRVRRQIQHLMQYSIDGVVSVERTDRQLRSIMRTLDKLETQDDQRGEAAYDQAISVPPDKPPTSPPAAAKADLRSEAKAKAAPDAAQAGPTSGPQLDPEIADVQVTWDDMTKVLQRHRGGATPASGTPASAPSANGQPGAVPREMPPTDEPPTEVPPNDVEPSP